MIPYIDRGAGADTKNWIKILKKVAEMAVKNVIPGHGKLTDKNGLFAQVQYFKDLRSEVEKFVKQGASLEETKKKLSLPKYQKMFLYKYFFPNNIEAIYEEITAEKRSQKH